MNFRDPQRPDTAVVSAAFTNRHGHPRLEVLERLDDHTGSAPSHQIRHATGSRPNYTFETIQDYQEAIYSTAVSGNIVITSDGQGYELETRHFEE